MAGAYPRSRTHHLWLRLCAPEPRREGGARGRERSCWCVEILGASEPALGAARLEQAAETKATVSVREGPHDGPAARGAKCRAATRKVEGERGPGLSALRTGAADWGCWLDCGGSIFQSGRGPHARTGVWFASFFVRPASTVACTFPMGEALRTPPPVRIPASLDRRGAAGLPNPDSRPACRGPRERKPGHCLAVAPATLTGCCTGSSQPRW